VAVATSSAGLPPAAEGLVRDLRVGVIGALGVLADWLQDNPEYSGHVLREVAKLFECYDYDPAPGDSRFGTTQYVVDGTSCERLMLWERYFSGVDWQQDPAGMSLTLGRVGTRPVVANFTWDVINGHRVLWCEMISEVRDHAMLDRWLDKHCRPMLTDIVSARCDAMNFHLCLQCIRGGQQEVWR
jgi:hypothetical protein